jgi:hypothetical protein
MTLIYAYKNLGITRDLVILDSASAAITPGANDKIRVIIGRTHEAPLITIASNAATANGSYLLKGASNRLRVDASDLETLDPGTYNLFFDYFDSADASEWKKVSNQVIHVEESPL